MARTSRTFHESEEAEFDLLRVRARPTPTRISSLDWPANDHLEEEVYEDDETVIVRRPSRGRQWAARFLGGVLLAGAIYGVSVASARAPRRRKPWSNGSRSGTRTRRDTCRIACGGG